MLPCDKDYLQPNSMNTHTVLPSSSFDHCRVESFIEHQDACNVGRASSPSPSSDTNISASASWPGIRMPKPATSFLQFPSDHRRNLELQLLPSSSPPPSTVPSSTFSPTSDEAHATKLRLSIGPIAADEPISATARFKDAANDELRLAMAEKAMAEEARAQAKRQIELAEEEFGNAKRIRQQAQAELRKACLIRDHAAKQINAMLLQITCPACRQQFRAKPALLAADEGSLAASHMSSVVTEGEANDDNRRHGPMFP